MSSYKKSSTMFYTSTMLVLLVGVTVEGQGSGGIPSCASNLVPCASYLNATKMPPSSCCDPLKEAVTKEKACLCNLYNNPDLLKQFGVNITQAMNLPKLCKFGTAYESDFCKGTAPSPSSTGSSSTPSGGSSSGSGSGSGSKDNASGRITGTGLVSALLMFGAYELFY